MRKSARFMTLLMLALMIVAGVTIVQAQDAVELPADCGTVELDFWNPFTGPDGPFMGQMVDAFNSEHSNIVVTMTTLSDYYTQLGTAAAAGTLPEVAIVHADQIATWAYRNALRPMDDVLVQVNITGDEFPAAVWGAGQVGDHRYSVPLDIHPMTMFVNLDLLGAAGIEAAPTNAEEFAAAAAAMTGGDNNGFNLTSGFPVRQEFEQLLQQFGGSAFNEDGTEAVWNSEAGVQAAQWLLDAQAAYSQPNLEVDAELNSFKGGTVGMIWNGIWQTTNVTGDGVFFSSAAVPVPQVGTEPAVWAGSHQFTLPVQAETSACVDTAAAIFIRYMLDNSVTWARAGQLPASAVVRASDAFLEVHPQAEIAAGSADYVFFPPSVPGITDAYGPLDEAISALMAGTATDVQAELDDAVQRANQILEQNRATYTTAPGA